MFIPYFIAILMALASHAYTSHSTHQNNNATVTTSDEDDPGEPPADPPVDPEDPDGGTDGPGTGGGTGQSNPPR